MTSQTLPALKRDILCDKQVSAISNDVTDVPSVGARDELVDVKHQGEKHDDGAGKEEADEIADEHAEPVDDGRKSAHQLHELRPNLALLRMRKRTFARHDDY